MRHDPIFRENPPERLCLRGLFGAASRRASMLAMLMGFWYNACCGIIWKQEGAAAAFFSTAASGRAVRPKEGRSGAALPNRGKRRRASPGTAEREARSCRLQRALEQRKGWNNHEQDNPLPPADAVPAAAERGGDGGEQPEQI